MVGIGKGKHNLQEIAFYVILVLNAAVFPFSEALISISAGLLLLQALLLRSWLHPSVKSRSWNILFFPVSVFLVYLVGMIFTNDFSLALYELKKMIFWLVIPLAVFISPKLPDKKVYSVFIVFIGAVVVSSLIITGRLLAQNTLQFAEFRKFSIISHIRFSIQVGSAIIFLAWFFFQRKEYAGIKIKSYWIVAVISWLFFFLILLKSLVGLFALGGTVLIAMVFYTGKLKNRNFQFTMVLLFILLLFIPVFYIAKVYTDFYDFEYINPEKVENKTVSGNKYHHDFNQFMRENGHLVYIYVCEPELREEWNKRSAIKYDDNLNGYPLGSTLIRYLASKGLRKDSTGVSKLTVEDIQLIERGATNFRFKNYRFSIYPRVYETIWEMDYYLRTKDPNNKTLAQRIEFLKAALFLIKENPFFGIGTGNWVGKYNEAYRNLNTRLSKDKWRPSHNQYLNYTVKFGFIGFLWILFAIIWPVIKMDHRHNFIFIMFLVFAGIANLGDANLETHTGLSFFIFFYSFLLWNSTRSMKKSMILDH